MLTLKAAKANFFDRTAVTSAVSRARQKVLGRKGAYVRTVMRRLMKKRKGPAPAGQPPNAHVGLLRDKIFFAYDTATDGVLVGPALLRAPRGKQTIPELLNEGGKVLVRGVLGHQGVFVPLYIMSAASRINLLQNHPQKIVYRSRTLAARPFTAPALEKSLPYLAKEWKGAVTK